MGNISAPGVIEVAIAQTRVLNPRRSRATPFAYNCVGKFCGGDVAAHLLDKNTRRFTFKDDHSMLGREFSELTRLRLEARMTVSRSPNGQ
jgi:hypothetical protein